MNTKTTPPTVNAEEFRPQPIAGASGEIIGVRYPQPQRDVILAIAKRMGWKKSPTARYLTMLGAQRFLELEAQQ